MTTLISRFKGKGRIIWWTACSLLIIVALAAFFWLFGDLPDIHRLDQGRVIPSVRIIDRNGNLLYEVLSQNGGRNQVVPLSTIPRQLQQATIATEDVGFYSNPGVDVVGILRAMWINLRGGQTISGGSTITQQVARTLLMTPAERSQRNLRRKLREIALAWLLTRRLSKDQILGLYLNQTYYGGMAYGVEAAAQTFFGKPVNKLDLAECALIAGLPQSPALYNPFTDPVAAHKRQQVVLGLMEQHGYLTADQRALAERETLVFAETPYPLQAPHFVMMVKAQIDRLFSEQDIYEQGGLEVRTTLDLNWQRQAEKAVTRQLEALKTSPDGLGHNVHDAALVAIDPHSGEVLTLVGSPDYYNNEIAGAVNMAISPRQPGSALKPIVYATAMDPARSARSNQPAWTAATMLLDVKTSFLTRKGQSYVPQNYDLLEHGPVLLREALASSLNIPAVLALDHIGLPALFEQATAMGITTLTDPDHYDLTLALGGGEVSLFELTTAYAVFANGGYRITPVLILEIKNLQGEILFDFQSPANLVKVLDHRVAWLISDILSDNDARLVGFGANSVLRLDRPAAVKTGTTSNFHDNWTVGYTPDLVVGVWAGNADYQPMRDVNGLSGAAPIWHQYIRTVLAGSPPRVFQRPDGLTRMEICALSGLLPAPDCSYRRYEWFINGTEPHRPDTFYRRVQVDAMTGRLAGVDTSQERQRSLVVLDLPASAWAWARSRGLTLLSDLQGSSSERAIPSSGEGVLQIVTPAVGSIYRFNTGGDPSAQQLHIEAAGDPGLRQVTIWIDGEAVATIDQPPYEIWWPLKVGVHQVWAVGVNPDGTTVTSPQVTFEIR